MGDFNQLDTSALTDQHYKQAWAQIGGGGTGDAGDASPPRFFRWGTEYQMSPPPPHVLWVRWKLELFNAFFLFFFACQIFFGCAPGKVPLQIVRCRWRSPQKSVGVVFFADTGKNTATIDVPGVIQNYPKAIANAINSHFVSMSADIQTAWVSKPYCLSPLAGPLPWSLSVGSPKSIKQSKKEYY